MNVLKGILILAGVIFIVVLAVGYAKSTSQGCEIGEVKYNNNCIPIYSTYCENGFGIRNTVNIKNSSVTSATAICAGTTPVCTIGYCQGETLSPQLSYINDWFSAYWLNYFK